MTYVSWLLQDTWTDSFKSLPAAFKGHGTWCLFQCCFFMYFFFFFCYNGQQWVNEDKYQSFFFLRSPMRICVRVWSCVCSVPQFSAVGPSLIITWLLNCFLKNNVTRNSLYSWRYKRCHSRDQLIDWYRQNMHRLS